MPWKGTLLFLCTYMQGPYSPRCQTGVSAASILNFYSSSLPIPVFLLRSPGMKGLTCGGMSSCKRQGKSVSRSGVMRRTRSSSCIPAVPRASLRQVVCGCEWCACVNVCVECVWCACVRVCVCVCEWCACMRASGVCVTGVCACVHSV